jgi:hypothetical protein
MKIMITILFFLLIPSITRADRYEYRASVDSMIPRDSIGVRDTIFIPDHLIIDDINFYVGVGLPDQPWADLILIDVFSPSRARVRLHDWLPPTFYFYDVWYDRERPEDGPGQLEDYAGGDAYGPWEMFCFDPFQGPTLRWYNWKIEVITNSTRADDNTNPAIPKEFAISQVYPNPFNDQAIIDYAIPNQSNIKLEAYDISGRLIRTLLNGPASVGYHRVIWNGTCDSGGRVASGVYFLKLVCDRCNVMSRATLLK